MNHYKKFSDAEIQDISTSISINMRIQKNLNDLTERCESDDQSDKHLEARDCRYSCLIWNVSKAMKYAPFSLNFKEN